jgi:prephenate dehydrogenase
MPGSAGADAVRVAVLGVGLIGGSIGLAAKRRLDAEVVGWDPEAATGARAIELGAIDRAADSITDAATGADAIFCAAPVRALADVGARALAASGPTTVVTDVGSTKRGLVESLAGIDGADRFIGGHPLAGAETAGVENARAELFEGARWYLTPTATSEGVLYERLQSLIVDLGARPQAIDPGEHDRAMATISHLPHVLANVLVSRGAETLAPEGAERHPEVGRSFRDTSRVAGANPAIWADIFSANGEAVADEIDAVIERLRAAAELLRGAEPAELAAWQSAASEDRRALLESDRLGGPLFELRLAVSNRPGVVAELALALGREDVNIEDMSLDPAADSRTGAISLWIAGEREAEAAARIVSELGHSVTTVSGGA